MRKVHFGAASFWGSTAVLAGAFGAHFLRETVPERDLETFLTAANYQLFHAILLAVVGLSIPNVRQPNLAIIAGVLLQAGMLLFSGGLYLQATTDFRLKFAPPTGGLCFIAAWVLLGFSAAGTQKAPCL